MADAWLSLPSDRTVYSGLSTDFYPWTAVYADLAARPGFSGALDIRQGGQRARYVWVGGELRGGHGPDVDLGAGSPGRHFPRGQVSLTPLEPAAAALLWLCRDGEGARLPLSWPDARDLLASRRFRGALQGEGGDLSLWDDGRLVGGTPPRPGEALLAVAPRAHHTVSDLEAFWGEVFAAAAARFPLQESWAQVSARLLARHPCLDPFAQEVRLEGSALRLDPQTPVAELRPALLDLFRGLLAQHGLSPRALNLGSARQHPLWASSGLAALG